jgi:uncharacterized protein (DUF4415 family)
MKRRSRTDWQRVQAMAEAEIEANARSDAEAPLTDQEFWADAKVVIPPRKVSISIRLDADILEWFKNRRVPYQTLINGVLRNYMEHQNRQK